MRALARTVREREQRYIRLAARRLEACLDSPDEKVVLAAACAMADRARLLADGWADDSVPVAETPAELQHRRDAEVVALVGGRPALPTRLPEPTYSWDEECAREPGADSER